MTHPILQHFGEVFHHDECQPQTRASGPGRCTLIKECPGEPHLLSASTLVAIQAATMLLVDDRVSLSVVALAKPGARVVHVGKRHSGMTAPPAFVDQLILMAVREGEQVVYLQADEPWHGRNLKKQTLDGWQKPVTRPSVNPGHHRSG